MAACSPPELASALVTVVTGFAAAIVLVLRELRWRHPDDFTAMNAAADDVDPQKREKT